MTTTAGSQDAVGLSILAGGVLPADHLPDDAPVPPTKRRRSVVDFAGPVGFLGLFVPEGAFLRKLDHT